MRNSAIAPNSVEFNAVGKRFTVKYTNCRGSRLVLIQSTLTEIELNGNVGNHIGCLALLQSWVKIQARCYLVPWIKRASVNTGLTFNAIQIRGQKTRWGSCSSRGTISLNCKLLFLPAHLVSYIIMHELCHTVHLNHSKNFWALLSSFEPSCKTLDAEMKRAGRFVPGWVNCG